MEWLAFDNGYANVCQFRCAYNAVERCRWWQRLRKSAISHAVLLAANYRSLFIDLSRFSKDSGGFFQKILTVSFVFSLSLSLSLSLTVNEDSSGFLETWQDSCSGSYKISNSIHKQKSEMFTFMASNLFAYFWFVANGFHLIFLAKFYNSYFLDRYLVKFSLQTS